MAEVQDRAVVEFDCTGVAVGKMRNDLQVTMALPFKEGPFVMATDEGSFHGGDASAPPPLALFVGGLTGCIMTQIRAFAKRLGVKIDDLKVETRVQWDWAAVGRVYETAPNAFSTATDEATRFTEGTLPNGLAFARDGSIYISNFGTDCLELMQRNGDTKVLFDTIDGKPIGKVNFVLRDSKDRIWITVSTQIKNWMDAAGSLIRDGSIILVDGDSVRTVATDIAFTNEVRLDANEEWLYAVETTARKITRFRVADDGSLTNRQTFGPEDHGAFIDGIAFDSYGNLWGTHVMCDQIFAITPQGELRIILDDDNPGPSRALYEAFERGQAKPEHMLACGGTIAPWFASVTFGGPDLKTVYIGSLRGTRIPYFKSPVAGLPMVHWNDPRP